MDAILPKTYVNKVIKERRENKLFSLEQSLMPDTQRFVTIQRKANHIKDSRPVLMKSLILEQAKLAISDTFKECIDALMQQSTPNQTLLSALEAETPESIFEILKIQIDNEATLLATGQGNMTMPRWPAHVRGQVQNFLRNYGTEIQQLTLAQRSEAPEGDVTPKEPKGPTRACTQENCRGFMNTCRISIKDEHGGGHLQAMCCGLCSTSICTKCHAVIGTEANPGDGPSTSTGAGAAKRTTACMAHVCNEAEVASVKAVMADSKPCPNCAAPISRISGCDHMWCTQCQTPFSWRTGKITANEGHNPHYTAWLNSQRRSMGAAAGGDVQPANNMCNNGPIDMARINRMGRDFRGASKIVQTVNHIYFSEIPPLEDLGRRTIVKNRDLRIKYMEGSISDEQFKKTLQQREKQADKSQEILQVYQALTAATRDIIQRLTGDHMNGLVNVVNVQRAKTQAQKELEELRVQMNAAFEDIGRRYNASVPNLTDSWVLSKHKVPASNKRKRLQSPITLTMSDSD